MKISPKQYAISLFQSIDGKSAGEVKGVIKRFVGLLIKHGQINKAEKIINEFIKVWNKEKGIVEAEITSAKELNKEIVKLLNGYIIKLSGAKEIVVSQKIDRKILGGVVLKYGDKILDGSLKTRLNEFKDNLIK